MNVDIFIRACLHLTLSLKNVLGKRQEEKNRAGEQKEEKKRGKGDKKLKRSRIKTPPWNRREESSRRDD